jgi:hypothetical protein
MQSTLMLPALKKCLTARPNQILFFNSKVQETIFYLLLIFSVVISLNVGYKSGLEKK